MAKEIKFYKYEGTGNDFIILDRINEKVPNLTEKEIKHVCHRRFGVGADGLIILQKSTNYDFEMLFYNSDGKIGTMCGNGGRCIVAFAKYLNLINQHTTFLAPDGIHKAIVESDNVISLKMADITDIQEHKLGLFIYTGSPHLLIFNDQINLETAYTQGKEIRYNETYKKQSGVNVNFISTLNNKTNVITYERGVEDITYSCGTGSVASALALNIIKQKQSPITINTQGGILQVKFEKTEKGFENIWLQGTANQSFKGTINI